MAGPVLVTPEAAAERRLTAFGDEIIVHLGGEDTGGALSAFTSITPPGAGPPPHHHELDDEWFLPQEGRVEFLMSGEWREVPVGSAVFVPRGEVHAFRNCGETPLTMLIQTSPAGFETFFARCAEEFAKPGGPEMARIIEIGTEHGIHFAAP